jgi:hypothetical protein
MLQNPEITKNTKYQNNRDLRAIGKLLCFGSQIRVRVKHTPRRTCNLAKAGKAGSAGNEGVVAGSGALRFAAPETEGMVAAVGLEPTTYGL